MLYESDSYTTLRSQWCYKFVNSRFQDILLNLVKNLW